MTTLVIGAIVLGLFYYFNIYSTNNLVNTIKTEEVKKCIDKFDTDQIYEFPNMLSDSECDKIIELSRDKVRRSTVIGSSKRNDISRSE